MSATERKMLELLPAVNSKLDTNEGIMRRNEVEKLYGRAIISLAVSQGFLKSVTILKKSKTERHEKFSVICNGTWLVHKKLPKWME